MNRRDFIHTATGLTAIALSPEFLAAAPRAADPVGIAVIGAGRQGRAIMAELQKISAAKIIVVCDNDAGRLRSGLGRAAGAEGVEDYRKALERNDVAAVIIATPTHEHRVIVDNAVAAGKHVYCEAPIAHTVEEAKAIAATAAKSKGVFAVGLEGRSNPVYKLARTFYRAAAGDLVALRAQCTQKTSWRFPVSDSSREKAVNWRLDPAVSIGLAGEIGTHQYDVLNWYTGLAPTTVRGSGAVRFYNDGRTVADTVDVDFGYANGTRLQYLATLGSSYLGKEELLYCSNATFRLAWTHGWMFKEADAPTQGWEVYANRQQFHNDEGITLIADATKLASQGKLKEGVGLPNPSLYYAIEDFVRSIVDGTPAVCGAMEGATATTVGILANKAVVTKQEVTLDSAPGA